MDDVSYFRLITRKYLENAGYQVVDAGSAVEALEKLSKIQIDLVILDYQLPDIDGLSFFQKIQDELKSTALCRSKVPPFILCTASLDDKAARRAAEMGFSAIFAKPVDSTRLLSAIDKALRPEM